MSSAVTKALSYFDPRDTTTPKLNCGQAVLAGLGQRLGIDERTAIRAGRALAGGIGHQGNICGALCAGTIALGFGAETDSEARNRSIAYAHTRELFRRFRERHGDVECRLLIGIDPSTPEGEREVHEKNIHRTLCTRFVRSTVEIVEDLLRPETPDFHEESSK